MIRKIFRISKIQKLNFSLQFNSDKDFELFLEKGFFIRKTDRNLPKEEIEKLTKSIVIPNQEIELDYCSSSGPGGQHVNRTASKAVLKFNIPNSQIISDRTKRALMNHMGNQINKEGFLTITSQKFREQQKNKQDVIEKLKAIIAQNSVEQIQEIVKMQEETPEQTER